MLRIRAHHLLCIRGFHGLGYSADFIQKMTSVKDMFVNHPELEIKLVAENDEICSACPHNRDSTCLKHDTSDIEIRDQDLKVLKALNIPEYTQKTIKELNALVDEKINSFSVLAEICGTCEWTESCLFFTGLRDSLKEGEVL